MPLKQVHSPPTSFYVILSWPRLCFITCKYSASRVLFFPNVFQLEEALSCGLSLIFQVLLVITSPFELKRAYSIAIQTQNFRKKNFKVSVVSHYLGFVTAAHEKQVAKWQNPKYRVFQKFVPIVHCILSKAFNTFLGKCKLIQVRNISK